MSNYPLSTKNYELLHLVGSGTYSRVYEANCRDNNQVIAIKQINLDEFPLELETIQRQTAFWSKCDHPNVVQYYGSFVDGSTLWILNEYMGAGSLKDIIKYGYPNGFKNENLVAALLAQIITGIKFFHDNHEIHRDIRSNNILVNSEGFVKLGDFGLATSLVKGGTRQGSTLSLFGEECYMAPEVLRNENGYSEKTDIWSLGLTAIELGTGKMPYAGMKFMESLVQIIDHDPPSLPDTKEYSSAYKDFVKQCLNSDPAKRATAGELLNHRFLKPYTGLGLSSANLLNNNNNNANSDPSSTAAAYIKNKLASQLPPLHTIFEKLHQYKESAPAHINKTPSQMVFDFSSVEDKNDKDGDNNTEKVKSKEKGEHKHHHKHGHRQKRRHHKEKKSESDDSDEDSDEKKKTSNKRKSKSVSSDSDYEKEEESSNAGTDSESDSDYDYESKKKSKKSKKKRETKKESNSDDDDVAYDNSSSTESDEYSEKEKRKERKSKKKKSKRKHRKTKSETNDDQSVSQKEEKKDVQKMGRFSVTRTESNKEFTNSSSPKITASISHSNSQGINFQPSQSNLDQQQRIEILANEISSLSTELTRLENENVSLKKRLEEVIETVTELQNSK